MSEPRKLRITLAQLNATVGDIDGNLKKMIETWKQYDSETDLVVFPELFLCGYPPEDLAHNTMFLRDLDIAIDTFADHSKTLKSAIVIPTIKRTPTGYKNTLLVYQNGEEIHYQEKVKLPNYGVFDEQRIFSPAENLPKILEFHGVKIGFLICEDLWFDDVFTHLKNEGAEFLVSINGSPYDTHKLFQRFDVVENCKNKTGLMVAYLNLVGGQDDLVFDGHSFVSHCLVKKEDIIPTRRPIHAHGFEEDIIQLSFTQGADIEATSSLEIKYPSFVKYGHYGWFDDDILPIQKTYSAILLGLKDYVRKNGFQKVLLGLSGGIDSALVACMAVDALGAENVRCIMLPSEFTSQESLEDAEQCAKNLGVKYEIIPIQDAIKTFEKLIPDLKDLSHENTQSRIRGLILMALSNISGEMLLSTGNKSELATGYATLYGDMNGGFNPLKDIYKTQVYHLAGHRNSISPVIPKRIIEKEPSAELRPNQTDQDSLPDYDALDDILFLLLEFDDYQGDDFFGDVDQCLEFDPLYENYGEDFEKVAKLLRASEFKRRQSCPGPKITPRAFGKDRRYPITNKFLNRIENP